MSQDQPTSPEEIEQIMTMDPWWKELSDELDRVHMVRQLKEVVPAKDKIEVINAMLEHLHISEEDLAKAQDDIVFKEAKTIIEALKSGDSFPDRLAELYNSRIPETLGRINQSALTLAALLSDRVVQSEIERLWASNRHIFKSIDMNKLPRNLHLHSYNDRYILRSIMELQQLDELFRNGHLYPFVGKTYTPAAVRELENKEIEIRMDAANGRAECLLNQRAKYLAYRVYDPLWSRRMERFEPEYVAFPLKWINDPTLLEACFKQYRAGKDITSVFISLYDEWGLNRLRNAISSCPITQPQAALFMEAIDSYNDNRFRVCSMALLPLIEGLVWEFAWWWNKIRGGLFDRAIGRTQYKYCKDFSLIGKDGTKTNGRPTLGTLLRQTKFGEEVYFEVVEHLVEELYEERNPTLHGREPNYGNRKKAATLLFVVETLERYITQAIKDQLGKEFIDNLTKAGKMESEESANDSA